MLGRVADYEEATELAEHLVHDVPDDGTAWLARARTRATFHLFAEALADLDAAERRGVDRAASDSERAAILHAVGCSTEAVILCRAAAEHRPDFTTLGALAVLEAEQGELADAEALFAAARRHYRDVSPFPVAELDFRRGLMWLRERDLPTARVWFEAAMRRVPAHAAALGHLAEVEAALGAIDAAIDRLHAAVASGDDPQYAAILAVVLDLAGCPAEAEQWRARAAARYDELATRHPQAFADHAADFRRSVDRDPRTVLAVPRTGHGHSHSPGYLRPQLRRDAGAVRR
jgi:tetratricopeptide (TPR) repeat protein